jgi:hypothetical protein
MADWAGPPLVGTTTRVRKGALGAVVAIASVVVWGTVADAVSNPPDTTITAPLAGETITGVAFMGLTGTDDVTDPSFLEFECTIDGDPVACFDGLELPPLADGPHTLTAAAIDEELNVDPTPASVAFTVDLPDPPAAGSLATAAASAPGLVTGAQYVVVPPASNGVFSVGVGTDAVGGFPVNGGSYALLSSGDTDLDDAVDSTSFGTGPVRGDSEEDVTILRIDLAIPTGATCLGFDFRYWSEEFPQFVGTSFNDAFIAELDSSTWTTTGSTISAPANFAFDSAGDVISINSSGATSMSEAEAVGTTLGGATELLTASVAVTPGAHSLFLSIFDQGDTSLDSVVAVDNLRAGTAQDDCGGGSVPVTPVTAVDDSASTTTDTPVVVPVLANDLGVGSQVVTVTVPTAPANGTAVVGGDGSVTYTPAPGFDGTDSFGYEANGSPATVTVTVAPATTTTTTSTTLPPTTTTTTTLPPTTTTTTTAPPPTTTTTAPASTTTTSTTAPPPAELAPPGDTTTTTAPTTTSTTAPPPTTTTTIQAPPLAPAPTPPPTAPAPAPTASPTPTTAGVRVLSQETTRTTAPATTVPPSTTVPPRPEAPADDDEVALPAPRRDTPRGGTEPSVEVPATPGFVPKVTDLGFVLEPGGSIAFLASGVASCDQVVILLDGAAVGAVRPNARGEVDLGGVALPGDAEPGEHVLSSRCGKDGEELHRAGITLSDGLHRTALVTDLVSFDDAELGAGRLARSVGVAVLLAGILGLIAALLPAGAAAASTAGAAGGVAGGSGLVTGGAGLVLGAGVAAAAIAARSGGGGLDASTAALVVGVGIGLLVLSFAFAGGRFARPSPVLVAAAVLAAVVTPSIGFAPGLVLGALAGFRLRPRLDGDGRSHATVLVGVLVLAMASWFAWSLAADAAADGGGFALYALEATLATIFVGGVQTTLVALVPVAGLPGTAIVRHSRAVWAVLVVLAGTCFVQLLGSHAEDGIGGTEAPTVIVVTAAVIGALAAVAVAVQRRERPAT